MCFFVFFFFFLVGCFVSILLSFWTSPGFGKFFLLGGGVSRNRKMTFVVGYSCYSGSKSSEC